MFIQWKEELALGNALIDTQHRMLMLLCRKLDIAIKTGQSSQTVQRVMLEVKKFTEFHFVSEQNLMHEIGYPEVDAHSKLHTDLLIELQVHLSKISHKAEFPEDVLYALNEWLGQHIVEEDMKLAQYVRAATHRPIGEHLYEQFLPQTQSAS
jgi:hemerythrin-like metal-binding protein